MTAFTYAVWIATFTFPDLPQIASIRRRIEYSAAGFLSELLFVLLVTALIALLAILLTRRHALSFLIAGCLSMLTSWAVFILIFAIT